MTNGTVAAVGGGAAAAAIANAIKASGVLVRVGPDDFTSLLGRARDGLVVYAQGGLFSTTYSYVLSYKGFAFYTRSKQPLPLPGHVETVHAASIWVPG